LTAEDVTASRTGPDGTVPPSDDPAVLSLPGEAPSPDPRRPDQGGGFAPDDARLAADDARLAADADGPPPAWVGMIPVVAGEAAARPPAPGPPGGRIFSLEGRPAPGLYLVAWLLSVGGLAALFVTSQAAPSTVRSVAVLAAIVAVGLGLSAGAGYQIVARGDREDAWYRGPSPPLVFGVVLTISALVSGLLSATDLLDPDRPIGFLLGLLVVAGAYLVTVWLFAVRSGALSWPEMGWPVEGPGRLRRTLQGIGLGALVMIPTTFGALLLAAIAASLLDVEAPSTLPSMSTSAEALAVAIAAAIVAPIGEELFFRGFALSAWVRDLPVRAALIRSAVFFALVHVANITATTFAEGAAQALLQVIVILPLGLVLGWLFLRRGIAASIAGHITYNGLLLALLLLQTGTATAS
jgi:uncharacterized protein